MYYKYRHWNQYTKNILTSNSLYYSDATSFNDLFECVVSPEANTSFRGGGHKTLITAARNNYRILCLSKAKNHPLMWAHYADSFKGVCLEFDFIENDHHFNVPRPIRYEVTPPIVSDLSLNTSADISNEMFFFKHKSWEYEQEFRIQQPKANATVPFMPNSLKAVYIGPPSASAPIFDDVANHVQDYNRHHNSNVKFIRLKRREYSYVIEEEVIF